MTENSKKWMLTAVNVILTFGASLTLGLLSFGGFYAIIPSIWLGISSLTLATIYEAEIYYTNIKDALNKLLKPNFFNSKQATDNIKELFDQLKSANKNLNDLPQFFRDYQTLEYETHRLNHKHSHTLAISIAKYKANKELNLMQRFFEKALFNQPLTNDKYAKDLKNYLAKINNGSFQQKIIDTTQSKKAYIKAGFYFSILSAALFSIGSVYLILETLTTLTFVTLSLPTILTLSAICGAAYGLLTYNSLANLIWNDTIPNWKSELQSYININEGKSYKIIPSLILIVLAGFLTFCTAGTWLTIVKHSKNLPAILKRIPTFVTSILIPLIISTATLVFTLENTKSSLDNIIKKLKHWYSKDNSLISKSKELFNSDNKTDILPTFQKYNPFNAMIYILETPLRMIGFILHIASIGVTTDRVNGVPKSISAGFSMLSEGFEDYHYFVGNDDSHTHVGHDHSNDIPTIIIKLSLSPLYALSSCYHWACSQVSSQKVDFKDAWQQRFRSNDIANQLTNFVVNIFIKTDDVNDSTSKITEQFKNETSCQWQQQKILMQLNEKLSQINGDDKLSLEKREILKTVKANITAESSELNKHLTINKQSKDKLGEHRNFWHQPGSKTSSIELIESLQSQVTP